MLLDEAAQASVSRLSEPLKLVEQIMYYIKSYNEEATPFSWNYTGKPLTV